MRSFFSQLDSNLFCSDRYNPFARLGCSSRSHPPGLCESDLSKLCVIGKGPACEARLGIKLASRKSCCCPAISSVSSPAGPSSNWEPHSERNSDPRGTTRIQSRVANWAVSLSALFRQYFFFSNGLWPNRPNSLRHFRRQSGYAASQDPRVDSERNGKKNKYRKQPGE
jgi:hypothetical protein